MCLWSLEKFGLYDSLFQNEIWSVQPLLQDFKSILKLPYQICVPIFAALREKKFRGAALDVFQEEPLPESSELWKLDNVLISPHCADRTTTFLEEAMDQFIDNVKLYVEGKDLINVCDKNQGY